MVKRSPVARHTSVTPKQPAVPVDNEVMRRPPDDIALRARFAPKRTWNATPFPLPERLNPRRYKHQWSDDVGFEVRVYRHAKEQPAPARPATVRSRGVDNTQKAHTARMRTGSSTGVAYPKTDAYNRFADA